jgi:hypothetical protein
LLYVLDTSPSPSSIEVSIPSWTSYVEGASLRVKLNNATAVGYPLTIMVNNLPYLEVKPIPGLDMTQSSIPAGTVLDLVYDGQGMQIQSMTTTTVYQNRIYGWAINGQNTINIAYKIGFVDVWLNGVKLMPDQDFTATDGTTISLSQPLVSVPEVYTDCYEVIGWL